MTLGTAALLLAAAVIGIILSGKFLRERPALRMACIALLSLTALVLAGYIGLTALFVDAVRNQPPAQ